MKAGGLDMYLSDGKALGTQNPAQLKFFRSDILSND
jgi:hypothetical protein